VREHDFRIAAADVGHVGEKERMIGVGAVMIAAAHLGRQAKSAERPEGAEIAAERLQATDLLGVLVAPALENDPRRAPFGVNLD